MPRSALGFITMWLQTCGLGNASASFVVSVSFFTSLFASLLSGVVTDAIHKKYPVRGRPVVAQTAILLRCVLLFIMLRCIGRSPQSFYHFLTLSAAIGLLAGWPGIGVNRPILTEIVNPNHRATVFSLVNPKP